MTQISSRSSRDEYSVTKNEHVVESKVISEKPSTEGQEDEAVRARMIDGVKVIGLSDEDFDHHQSFTPQMRKRLNYKVDIRLLPILGMLYLVSNLDRVNIGNAKIEGMAADLNMTSMQYSVALCIFFISYIIMGM